MNCDRVFMVLTRGPFPSGAVEDHAVEDHLLGCASCRRLALQPAIELFEEATPLDEKDGLPTYWGQLVTDIPSDDAERDSAEPPFARSIPRPKMARFSRLEPLRRSKREPIDTRSRWPLAGAFLVGIVFCLTTLEWMVNTSDSQAGRSPVTTLQTNEAMWNSPALTARAPATAALIFCPRSERRNPQENVQPGLVSVPEAKPTVDPESRIAVCCTECHAAGEPAEISDDAMPQVILACQGCHRK